MVVAPSNVVPVTANALLLIVAPPRANDVPAATPRTGVTNVGDVVALIAPEPFNATPRAVWTLVPRGVVPRRPPEVLVTSPATLRPVSVRDVPVIAPAPVMALPPIAMLPDIVPPASGR